MGIVSGHRVSHLQSKEEDQAWGTLSEVRASPAHLETGSSGQSTLSGPWQLP